MAKTKNKQSANSSLHPSFSQSLKEKLLLALVGGVFYVFGVMSERVIDLLAEQQIANIELADVQFDYREDQFNFLLRNTGEQTGIVARIDVIVEDIVPIYELGKHLYSTIHMSADLSAVLPIRQPPYRFQVPVNLEIKPGDTDRFGLRVRYDDTYYADFSAHGPNAYAEQTPYPNRVGRADVEGFLETFKQKHKAFVNSQAGLFYLILFRAEITVSDREAPIKIPSRILDNRHPNFRYGPSCDITWLRGHETWEQLYSEVQSALRTIKANLASLRIAQQWEVTNPKFVNGLLEATQSAANLCTFNKHEFKALVAPLLEKNKQDIDEALSQGIIEPDERFGIRGMDLSDVITHGGLSITSLRESSESQGN